MTEQQWLTSTNPAEMVAFLSTRITDEQRRFFVEACLNESVVLPDDWALALESWHMESWCKVSGPVMEYYVPLALRADILRDIVPFRPIMRFCGGHRPLWQSVPNDGYFYGELPLNTIEFNRAWLTWNDGTIPKMVDAMLFEDCSKCKGRGWFKMPLGSRYDDPACNGKGRIPRAEPRWADIPVIADALEEAGCSDQRILEHLRDGERCPWCKDGSIEVELCEGACTTKANCSRCKGTGRIKRRHYIGCHIVELLKGTNGETPMNHTTALCGHSVPAWGSPGSPARSRCENEPCDECRRRNTWNAVQLYVAECEAYDVSICGPDGMPKTSEQAVAINRHAKKVRDRLLNEMAIDNLEFTKELRYYWDLEHKKKRNR